jgi:hypothetical protein
MKCKRKCQCLEYKNKSKFGYKEDIRMKWEGESLLKIEIINKMSL